RHLPAGHRVAWTEPVVGGRVAPPGDPGGGELFDVAFEDVAVVVVEGAPGAGVVVAADPLGPGGEGVEMDRVVLGRGVVAAVVDVEPQRLHLETALPRPTEHHVPGRVRDLAVDETLHHAIGTARRVHLHVRLDAVPAPVTEGGDVGVPGDD